jgi:diguanylate cyclase (GGDEF)-like protein/PAS domain S-box-containing protein
MNLAHKTREDTQERDTSSEAVETMQPNILIVDDVHDNIRVIASILKTKNYQMSFAMDGISALETVQESPFDLVLLDVMMPRMNGFEVCRRMRSNPETRHIPIIFVTAKSDQDSIVEGFNVGGVDYITKPFNSKELVARIENQISLKRAMDQVKLADQLIQTLGEGVLVTDPDMRVLRTNPAFTQITGYEAEEVMGRIPPQLQSPEMSEEFHRQLVDQLEANGKWRGEQQNCRKDGAPYEEELKIFTLHGWKGRAQNHVVIFSDISERKQAEAVLKHQALHDPLTGLPNRTLFRSRLDLAMREARSASSTIALLFIDLDGFKQVNDEHGHEFGDLVLKESAGRLKDSMRGGDLIARLGGDEFIAMLSDAPSRDEIAVVANKVIEILEQPVSQKNRTARISASVGIALYPDNAMDAHHLVRKADAAMYAAKQSGKGRAIFSDDGHVCEVMDLNSDEERR